MDLFVCDKCDHVDAVELAYPDGPLEDGKYRKKWLCTKCITGTWHEYFTHDKYRPDFDIVVNRPTGLGLETTS